MGLRGGGGVGGGGGRGKRKESQINEIVIQRFYFKSPCYSYWFDFTMSPGTLPTMISTDNYNAAT